MMSIIELGALASATIAVITLITKLFNLISAIQQLIHRLDSLQNDVNNHEAVYKKMIQWLNHLDHRLIKVETKIQGGLV